MTTAMIRRVSGFVGGALLLLALSGCHETWQALRTIQPQPVFAEAEEQAVVVGDPARGAALFRDGIGDAPACVGCHALTPTTWSLAPVMEGIGARAAQRVEGLSAEAYLEQSITDPSAYLVPGFRNIMFPQYGERLSERDRADLIAYLMTL